VTCGKFKKTPSFEGKIGDFLLYATVPNNSGINELYHLGLQSLQSGGFEDRTALIVEKARKDKSTAEFTKKTGLKSTIVSKLGVSSTFFKPADQEDNFTNHAPREASSVHTIYDLNTQDPRLKQIVESGSWILKVSCLLSCGQIIHDQAIEIRRFRNILKACDIFMSKQELKELAQAAKCHVVMPTEAAEDGIIVEDLLGVLE